MESLETAIYNCWWNIRNCFCVNVTTGFRFLGHIFIDFILQGGEECAFGLFCGCIIWMEYFRCTWDYSRVMHCIVQWILGLWICKQMAYSRTREMGTRFDFYVYSCYFITNYSWLYVMYFPMFLRVVSQVWQTRLWLPPFLFCIS